mgnify:CR=1 FL=1
MRFSEVIGQRELKRHLVRGVDAGRVSHAQLFTGRPGAGALPLALAYVQYLNCTNRRDGDSCGECPNCRQIAGLAHPDLHFVFPVNKQGKKSGEAVLSDDFMPLWRQVVSERNGYFSPQEWYDALDLGKTLRGAISAREADEIIRFTPRKEPSLDWTFRVTAYFAQGSDSAEFILRVRADWTPGRDALKEAVDARRHQVWQ